MVPEVREALQTFSVDLVVELLAALAVLPEVLVALVALQTFLVDLVAVLQAVLEATLLPPATLPELLLLALLQAERPRVLLPLPALVRVTPQPQ